jgi:hypothetical protein
MKHRRPTLVDQLARIGRAGYHADVACRIVGNRMESLVILTPVSYFRSIIDVRVNPVQIRFAGSTLEVAVGLALKWIWERKKDCR